MRRPGRRARCRLGSSRGPDRPRRTAGDRCRPLGRNARGRTRACRRERRFRARRTAGRGSAAAAGRRARAAGDLPVPLVAPHAERGREARGAPRGPRPARARRAARVRCLRTEHEDISETHGLWLEREPGIFERADWDEGTRTLRLSVRSGDAAAAMELHWLSEIEWRRLIEKAGFDVGSALRLVRPTPLQGRRGQIWVCGRGEPEESPCSVRAVIAVWIILAVVVVLVIYLIALYNGLVQKRNRVDNSWAQIEVQLKRRRDLIPNLVETVKGYAAHERGTFEAVTQARAAARGTRARRNRGGRRHPEPGPRTALRRRGGIPGPEGEHQLSRSPAATSGHREQDRRFASGLQRHGPDVQQCDSGVPRRAARRTVRFHQARVLRGGGCGRPRGTDRQLPAGRPGVPGSSDRRRCVRATEQLALLFAVFLAALAVVGPAGAKSFSLPLAEVSVQVAKDGSLGVVRVHHLLVQRPVQRRLPRDPASQRRVDRRRRCRRARPGLSAGWLHRARVRRCPRHLRNRGRRRDGPHRLALPGELRAAARSTSTTA